MSNKKTKDGELYERYNHDNLPKIKNHFLYTYRTIMKLFFYAYMGVGSILLAIFIFPWIKVFVHPNDKYQVAARKFVSGSFRTFIGIMNFTRATKTIVHERERFNNLHGKVLVANHPSILDFVYIMSLVPNANCIVRGTLTHSAFRGVIKQCYILNTLDFEELCKLCKETLDKGNNVIIFPEGTRTPRHGSNPFKKGAARIAFYAKADVQPILVGGNDKYGLGKHDPIWSYNTEEVYTYDFSLLDEIKIDDYKGMSATLAAKRITDKMEMVIKEAVKENATKYKTNHED